MECSVGALVRKECHKLSYSRSSKIETCTIAELELLRLRVDCSVNTVCAYHKNKFLNKFEHLFGSSCVDPFNAHKKKVKRSLM